MAALKTITLAVPTEDLEVFVDACSDAGWLLEDTGDRIMTEAGLDAEAVIRLTIPARQRKAEKQMLLSEIPC